MKPARHLNLAYLEEYQIWQSGSAPPRSGLWAYAGSQGGIGLAAVFSKLFFPDFVEVRGCVILAEHYEATNFQRWWRELDGKRSALERTLNHTHLYDLFDDNDVSSSDGASLQVYEYVASTLRES